MEKQTFNNEIVEGLRLAGALDVLRITICEHTNENVLSVIEDGTHMHANYVDGEEIDGDEMVRLDLEDVVLFSKLKDW